MSTSGVGGSGGTRTFTSIAEREAYHRRRSARRPTAAPPPGGS
ncbi:hypothetical protein [Streptomyces tendae]|nr:hypothetical protein [Streptomyces tendae]